MKILGEKLFAKGADGQLISRIGTMFLKTPGLVTRRGVHAMQRFMWIEEINRERAAKNLPPLTIKEEDEEMEQSVDLIFTEDYVLIRPDPEHMELAVRADEELQKMVSKLRIRYLNTNSAKVRTVLCERGENWRMARHPISQDDMADLILKSRMPICENPIYYYNRYTGTRFITASGYIEVEKLTGNDYRRQVLEVLTALNKRNRMGQPEVDLFPPTTPIEIKRSLREIKMDTMTDEELRERLSAIAQEWRMSLPAELRDETISNYEWRNEMCHIITRSPNETNVEESELINGLAPEFYRQIEWLPGARIDNGQVIFDKIYDEANNTQNPELLALCDNRVKSLLFNTTRIFGRVKFINIGRITRSLAKTPVAGNRRGYVYVVQFKEEDTPGVRKEPKVLLIRLQKWGVAEHLDEGRDMLTAILSADEYSDYVLDRRLMCCQLGMNLPRQLNYGHFTEKYRGANQYNGVSIRTTYFVRDYIPGMATDKIPPHYYRTPPWSQKFAFLLGEAAAIDLIVGRRSTVTNQILFDRNYEVLQLGEDGLPAEIKVTNHAGSFVDYSPNGLEEHVAEYAAPVLDRKAMVTAEYEKFALAYVEGFRRQFVKTRSEYLERARAYRELFKDRPWDNNGSGAYRWSEILKRLENADADTLASLLRTAIGC